MLNNKPSDRNRRVAEALAERGPRRRKHLGQRCFCESCVESRRSRSAETDIDRNPFRGRSKRAQKKLARWLADPAAYWIEVQREN